MKQRLLIASFFFFGISVFSQNYKPLLDRLNEWHVTTCYYGCHTDVYFTDGDTIVNRKTYKILDGYHFISRTFLLREEVDNKKIFLNFVSPGQSEEFLLYDFSLNQGDVFEMKNPVSPFPQDGGPFLLDSIVAKPLLDGNNYKHFYFSPTPENTVSTENAVWIEGVGSLSLINAPGGHPDFDGAGQLSCFFVNSEVLYANLENVEDCIPLHLEIKKNNLNDVIISKQNNSTKFILSNTRDVYKLSVFDISGKILREIKNSGNNTIIVDLSAYKNGLYIILVTGIGEVKKSFKIIK